MSEIRIDPQLKDYEMEPDGLLRLTDSLEQPGYVRLTATVDEWLYDPSLGSTFDKIASKASDETDTELIRRGEAALLPIIEDGRASSAEIKILERVRHGRLIEAKIVDARTNEVSSFPVFVQVP